MNWMHQGIGSLPPPPPPPPGMEPPRMVPPGMEPPLRHLESGVEGMPDEIPEDEVHAVEDARPRLAHKPVFQVPDTTINLQCRDAPSDGAILSALSDSGMQFLLAGARASVGVSAGRYMFEVRIEQTQEEKPSSQRSLRIGFALAGSPLLIGESPDSVCLDSAGHLVFNRRRIPLQRQLRVTQGSTLAVVLNLQEPNTSPTAQTLSFFKDGQRLCKPQPLPESLRGKALHPAVTFKNTSLYVNFGQAIAPLSFTCRTLNDVAEADGAVVRHPSETQVLFPVCLPDEGTFDWLDLFLKKNPHFTELSDRKLADWATKSGLFRSRGQSSTSSFSNDRPDMNFGVPQLEDGTTKQVLITAASQQQRSLVVMDVQGNLLKTERAAWLSRFPAPHRRVAQVMVGEPLDEFKVFAQEQILAAKKLAKAKDRATRLHEEGPDQKRRRLDMGSQSQVEGVSSASAVEEQVALSEDEQQAWFRKDMPYQAPDLTQSVLQSYLMTFTLPEDDEGFDEVKFEWQARAAAEEYMKTWVKEQKMKTRVENLQPSDWFRERLTAWNRDLQMWQAGQSLLSEEEATRKAEAEAAKAASGAEKAEAEAPALPSVKPCGEPHWDNWPVNETDPPLGTNGKALDLNDAELDDPTAEGLELLELLCEEVEESSTADEVFQYATCESAEKPLFALFSKEDWLLLELRFELHLLIHSFRRDCGEERRPGIFPDHLAFYYNRYFSKTLLPGKFGFRDVNDVLKRFADTIVLCGKVIESQLDIDVARHDIFVALTERQRRLKSLRQTEEAAEYAEDHSKGVEFYPDGCNGGLYGGDQGLVMPPPPPGGPCGAGYGQGACYGYPNGCDGFAQQNGGNFCCGGGSCCSGSGYGSGGCSGYDGMGGCGYGNCGGCGCGCGCNGGCGSCGNMGCGCGWNCGGCGCGGGYGGCGGCGFNGGCCGFNGCCGGCGGCGNCGGCGGCGCCGGCGYGSQAPAQGFSQGKGGWQNW